MSTGPQGALLEGTETVNKTTAHVERYTARNGLTYKTLEIATAQIRRYQEAGKRTLIACVECDHRPVMIDALASETDALLLAELQIHADRDHERPAQLTVTQYVEALFLL